MRIELGVSDRYSLMEVLIPLRGNFTDMITCRGLLSDVEITEQEMSSIGLRTVDGGLAWDVDALKQVDFTPQRLTVVRRAVMQMAEQGGLSGLLSSEIFRKLPFTREDVLNLKALVDELDKDGRITHKNLQACINIRGL